MTTIKAGSPVIRETGLTYRGRALVIECHPGYVAVREKGRRGAFAMSYDAIYERAMRVAAEQARAERQAAKKSKRGRR